MVRKADPNRKSDILQAAGMVFAQKGYAAARIIEIARAASVGKGTIYEYFPSKEALFFAVFEQMMAASSQLMTQGDDEKQGSFAVRMRTLADNMIQSWMEQLETYSLVMEFWAATASSPSRQQFQSVFKRVYHQMRQSVGAMIQDAKASGEVTADCDAYQIASAIIGTWDALLLQAWLNPEFDALATSRYFMDVVLRGLQASSEGEGVGNGSA